MYKIIKMIVMIGFVAEALVAQTRQETMDFIVRELKSCENEQLEFKDIEFADAGRSCKIKLANPGQVIEKTLEMTLSEVDVIASQKFVKFNNNEEIQVFSLLVSPRGRSGGLKRDHFRLSGPEVLVADHLSGTKIRGLEAAFAHLAELTTTKPRTFKRTEGAR